jgi:invasion protein IalB
VSTDRQVQAAKNRIACCVIVTLLVVIAGPGAAQQPPLRPAAPRPAPPAPPVRQPQQAAQNEGPQRSTATYEDWVVECQKQTGPTPEKVCDMAQVTQAQVQGRNIPFSRVAIARPVKGQPIKLTVHVPISVTFQTNVRVQTGDSDPGMAVPFARCLPTGCFADFEIKDNVLKAFRAVTTGPGKVSYADGGGHDVTIPLSFKGFGQAFDALAKE